MARSHERVTRSSRTGESSKVETEDEDGAEPLTAETISETARVWAGSESTGAVLATEATVEADPEDADWALSVRTVPADE
jgi:hypothetical protein